MMYNTGDLETKIKNSIWWKAASNTIDNHYSNHSGIMLTHHLLAVYNNIESIFNQPATGFYGELFALLPTLQLHKEEVKDELKIVALLHDIGKPLEDKSLVMPHPLTGKPAHKRHGLVGLMAAMEIIGADLAHWPEKKSRIYRTVELHDMSYGLFREFMATGNIPLNEKWHYINNKVHTLTGAGLMYLLLFKLADIHGHDNISDIIWFYETVKEQYFNQLNIDLPIPTDADIR
jgi:HD domain